MGLFISTNEGESPGFWNPTPPTLGVNVESFSVIINSKNSLSLSDIE